MTADQELIGLTADIVSAFVSKNSIPISELPALISGTYTALVTLGAPPPTPAVELVPAVSIRRSVTPDAIFSLEDGRPYKALKHHLSTRFNMTPDEYRTKWGLPSDYPMVAANYSEQRSAFAKENGLGRKSFIRPARPSKATLTAQPSPPKKRGRPRKNPQ